GGDGEPFEFAVRMAQFPLDALLDRQLAQSGLNAGHVDALAAAVAAFHAGIPSATVASGHGSPAAVRAPAEDNFAALRTRAAPDSLPYLAALEAWSRAEYQRLDNLIARRQANGFVRECHGDLHLGNMALLEDGPAVFDCIEFNPELRWIDIINDLAFLVMDLAERGRPDFAWRLLNDWLEILGDYEGLGLLRFYQVYRALVRAKVAGFRATDPAALPADREAAATSMAAYLAFAQRIASPGRQAIIVTHGFSGSGKTTLARGLAEHLGAIRLRSDVERKRLGKLPPLAASGSGIGDGLYADGMTAATYRRLADLAGQVSTAGYPVIVDAACLKGWQRDMFRSLARERGIPFVILDCHSTIETLEERVATRSRRGHDASEATPAVLSRQIQEADPLSIEELRATIAVATDGQDTDYATLIRLLADRGIPATA
ncbi:MAG TPA: AAA family ATPase, partial [Rhodocyclaceae bacterium]|nr:AAA family ATPase [Rhodocyclaceae bacterium]